MKCNLSFQQRCARRELVVANLRKKASCDKVVVSRVWNGECESRKGYSLLSKRSRVKKSQKISTYILQIKEADMDLVAEDLMSPQNRSRLSYQRK